MPTATDSASTAVAKPKPKKAKKTSTATSGPAASDQSTPAAAAATPPKPKPRKPRTPRVSEGSNNELRVSQSDASWTAAPVKTKSRKVIKASDKAPTVADAQTGEHPVSNANAAAPARPTPSKNKPKTANKDASPAVAPEAPKTETKPKKKSKKPKDTGAAETTSAPAQPSLTASRKSEAANTPSKAAQGEAKIQSNGVKYDQKAENGQHSNGKSANGETEQHLYIPKTPVSVPVFNTLNVEVCAILFSNLLDFSPSIGYALANLRPYKTLQHLLDQLSTILDHLPPSYLQSLLKRCSELGLVARNKLNKEQRSCAGLEKLPDSAKEELVKLYSQYREKFGFPFVVCAREARAEELATMIQARLDCDPKQELSNAVKELKKIAGFRLQEVVSAGVN